MDLKIGVIGGSGLGSLLGEQGGKRHEVETPFGRPSNAIVEVQWEGLSVFLLSRHGAGHLLNPSMVPYRANLFALKELGCTHVIASGAVGSLREEFRPRDLVIPDQIIDKTYKRANTFYEKAAVHVEFAEPFCAVLRQILVEAAGAASRTLPDSGSQYLVHGRGCYVCMEGPAFSSRAESLMHRLWGGDLIGMTAMPEAKLAREAEISYALVALVTDYDCWRNKPAAATGEVEKSKDELLKEIIGNLAAATQNAMEVIKRAIRILAERREKLPPSPAHSALKLGIWSEKGRIDREEVKRLGPLWMKYF
ncbi:MAG TPA: S-methyl-5'-thioadenosine phosphorylase [Tepidisphaeraceae bacterium]|nr:S-methyl-5'-thioadenosine phosphorylase [Tepidisphaeraceae bacterium]